MITTTTIHNLAADLADRIQGMQADNKLNNAQVIENLLQPVYDELSALRVKLSHSIAGRIELERQIAELKAQLK